MRQQGQITLFRQSLRPLLKHLKSYLFHPSSEVELKNEVHFVPNEPSQALHQNVPDMTIASKDGWRVKMIERWKLLENGSPQEQGAMFCVFVPKEEKEIFQQLIDYHQVHATLLKTG